jgi:CheY-like chemotaxis protein
LLTEYLKPEGFEITSVYDGEQGLQLAVSGADRYELIVLDIMLPSMNGFEVLRHLRSQSDTPVLMLTARDEEVDRIIGLEMGADDYLWEHGFRKNRKNQARSQGERPHNFGIGCRIHTSRTPGWLRAMILRRKTCF